MLRRLDSFVIALVVTAAAGALVPARGEFLHIVQAASLTLIAGLFWLYGARLSPAETLAGLSAWRPHLAILAVTFVGFPLLGVLTSHAATRAGLLTPELAAAVLLLTLVPSTVQSAVAFTGIAGGDRALAVVSASLSSLLGVWITPLLVALTMGASASVDSSSIVRIVSLLLVPFVLGQLLRPVMGGFVVRHDRWLRRYDRGSILAVVYAAFSQGTNAHVWSSVGVGHLSVVVLVCLLLLAAGFAMTWIVGRPFAPKVRIALTFCGTNQSLASGLPMASVLFAPSKVALIILPLMIYHLSQLVVCSFVATDVAARSRVR